MLEALKEALGRPKSTKPPTSAQLRTEIEQLDRAADAAVERVQQLEADYRTALEAGQVAKLESIEQQLVDARADVDRSLAGQDAREGLLEETRAREAERTTSPSRHPCRRWRDGPSAPPRAPAGHPCEACEEDPGRPGE
jgi:hypothetical protein